MADAPPLTAEQKEELRQRALLEIGLMGPDVITERRQVCVQGNAGKAKADVESRYGESSFPEVPEYCNTVLQTAVEKGYTPGLYLDLAIQQLGLGAGFAFNEQAEAAGTRPGELMRSIRAAADAGGTSYIDVVGTERPLGCPLALDAGATWASVNPDRVDRPYFTEAQAEKIAQICYNPEIKDVKVGATGEIFSIQQAGLAAGEILGQKWKRETDAASTTGAIDENAASSALPDVGPVPSFAPDRTAKQAKALGG